MARHVTRLKLASKPAQLYVRLLIIPLSQQVNHVSSGNIRHYVVAFICLYFSLTRCKSAQFIRRALHYASGSHKFLRQSAHRFAPVNGHQLYFSLIYIYIYIYIRGSLNKLPEFYRMGTFIDSRMQCTCCTVPITSGRPHRSPLA